MRCTLYGLYAGLLHGSQECVRMQLPGELANKSGRLNGPKACQGILDVSHQPPVLNSAPFILSLQPHVKAYTFPCMIFNTLVIYLSENQMGFTFPWSSIW